MSTILLPVGSGSGGGGASGQPTTPLVHITGDLTLTAADSKYVVLDLNTSNIVTLPVAADGLEFTIARRYTGGNGISADATTTINTSGGTEVTKIGTSGVCHLVCNGTNWVGIGHLGTKQDDAHSMVVIGYDATVYTTTTFQYGVCIGAGSYAQNDGVTIGGYADSGDMGVALGYNASAIGPAVAVGANTLTASSAVSVGGYSKAQGQEACAVGYSAEAQGSRSLAAGRLAAASASNATALGPGAQATGNYTVAIGDNSRAVQPYCTVIGRNSRSSNREGVAVLLPVVSGTQAYNGGVEDSRLNSQTTDGTLKVVGLGGSLDFVIPANGVAFCTGQMVAREPATGDVKIWKFEVAVKATASVVSIIGTPTITLVAEDAGATAWDLTFAGSANLLHVEITGEAAKTINWQGFVRIVDSYS